MKVNRKLWTKPAGWADHQLAFDGEKADLALVFGATALIQDSSVMADIRRAYPRAYVCGCSTSGEIAGAGVIDDSLVVTAVQFDSTTLRASRTTVKDAKDSFAAGQQLASAIEHDGLSHVFVLSDGLAVNGSELAKGLTSRLPAGIAITGGLAGDGARFSQTYVCAGGESLPNQIALIGFYGDRLRVGFGSMGGWDSFGPERRITRSRDNVLYELDGRSALDLYKEYLGPHAAGLPASGLLFPLSLRTEKSGDGIVRTILGINEKEQSMTFAGDMPEGSMARLMRANIDRLIEGAADAARACRRGLGDANPQLAVMISCVGRKLVLKHRVEEEIESVIEILGPDASATGFYSYGEICPASSDGRCALHNQTMTITTFAEVESNPSRSGAERGAAGA